MIEKTSTALEAGLQGPGIGDARTHGNLRRGFTADRESHKCGFKGMEERTCQVWTAQFLRSTGSEADIQYAWAGDAEKQAEDCCQQHLYRCPNVSYKIEKGYGTGKSGDSSVNSPRGMDLLGREYRLLKERLGAEGLFSRYRGIYLGWKVDSCLGFYDSFPEGQREAYVPVMCQDIKEDLDSGILQEEVPGAAQREIVLLAGQSADALGLRLRRTYDVYRQMKQKMESIEKERSVVVFGKGALGRLAGLYLVGRGRNIAAYIDNGAAAYLEQDTGRNTGTERNNIRGNFLFLPAPGVREDSSSGQKQEGLRIPLFAPERGASMYPDGVYVLASEAGHEDMKRQLLGLGISEENIISWGSYGYFLKHVLIESEKACRQEER